MRLDDIEVGGEYAIGWSGSRWGRRRARVTALRVYGSGKSRFYARSKHATYVELELLDENTGRPYKSRRGGFGPHANTWVDEGGNPVSHRVVSDDPTRYRHVWRVPAGTVLHPWSREVELRAERKIREAESRKEEERRDREHEDLTRRFQDMGLLALGHDWIEFHLSDARVIAEVLELAQSQAADDDLVGRTRERLEREREKS